MEQVPDKTDIVNIFKRLRAIPSNKVCFDCGAKNPTWASVTYGVFICMDCSAVHRSLGVHLSFVRSTQLDTNWTWLQLRAMQVGGNSKAQEFFQHHNHTTTDAQQKYNSRVANLYREKLHHLATSAMRIHGTKPIIDIHQGEQQHSHDAKEVDFFQEHTSLETETTNGNLSFEKASPNEHLSHSGPQPTVDHIINPPSGEASKIEQKSLSILTKPNKKGLGGKKGLGAQRIATDFKVIEKEAENLQALKEKSTQESLKKNEPINDEEESKKLASMRLAYQDLSLEQKKAESKLKGINPQKAEQMERLGMGFSSNPPTSITHSAMSDMKIIHQSNPQKPPNKNKDFSLDDDFEFLGFSMGPPKYGDSPFSSYGNDEEKNDIFPSKASWDKNSINKTKGSSFIEKEETPKRKTYSQPSSSNEAQKLFGNAKSISSSQFFGNNQESDIERRANLSKFESSKSISSAEFFGKPTTPESNVPNFYDIKEGVKGGVTKVAGRLSNLASGVITSIQDRYGY